MRKLFNFLFISVFALLIISCNAVSERDSDIITNPTTSSNYFQIDGGTKITINSATVQGFIAKTSSDVNFYSLSFISTDGTTSGKTVQLAITFPYKQLIDGTYSISSTTRNLDDFLSSYSEFSGTTMNSYNNLTQGTCTVKRSGSNFTIDFSIKPSNGKVIAGKFSGTAIVQEN